MAYYHGFDPTTTYHTLRWWDWVVFVWSLRSRIPFLTRGMMMDALQGVCMDGLLSFFGFILILLFVDERWSEVRVGATFVDMKRESNCQ